MDNGNKQDIVSIIYRVLLYSLVSNGQIDCKLLTDCVPSLEFSFNQSCSQIGYLYLIEYIIQSL